jgi:predicted transcriptional regulator
MKSVTVAARIPEELNEQLVTVAQALRRDRSWVIEEALRSYLASEMQFIEAVREGIRADDAGEVVDHEVVVADMADRRRRVMERMKQGVEHDDRRLDALGKA